MIRTASLLVVSTAGWSLSVSACSNKVPDLIRPDRPQLELREANVLIRPVPGGAELLGREVVASGEGSWRIAAERAPGCRVDVRRTPNSVREQNRVRLRSLAALDADYMALVGLGVGASSIVEVELDVEQSEVLTAGLAGPCGAHVITTLYVGKGRQSFFGHGEASVSGGLGGHGVGVHGRGEVETQIGDAIVWETPSAYAFEQREFDARESLQIGADLPSQLQDGVLLQVNFTASRPAYLVVFSVDAAGRKELLWPSNEEPAPRAAPDSPAELPSRAERARGFQYRLALAPGQLEPAREALLVYAFGEKGDFDSIHPHVLGGGAPYASMLDEQLTQIPAARWARYAFHYTLNPTSHYQHQEPPHRRMDVE